MEEDRQRRTSQLRQLAFALVFAGVMHFGGGVRMYAALVISFGTVFLTPRVSRWYHNTTRGARLTACAVVMVGSAVMVALYLQLVSALSFPPPNPMYWLAPTFVIAIPSVVFIAASVEAWRQLRSKRSREERAHAGD